MTTTRRTAPLTPLYKAIDQHRQRRRLTWKRLAEIAGVSHESVRKLRNHQSVSTETEQGVERALRLAPGSLEAVRRTGNPDAVVPLPDALPAGPASEAASVRPSLEGQEWLVSEELAGGGVVWRLTRIIDGRPASLEIVDDGSTPEEEIHREMREVMNEAEIRRHRRLTARRH